MAVARLEIGNLRCIERALLDLDARRNLIIGANGAGKTTILEAAYVLGRGHSFRVRDNRRLIRHGARGFLVRGEFGGDAPVRRVGVEYQRGTLDVRIDGAPGRRATQLAECLPVEVIDAGAHRLIDGAPGERRRFVDWALFHVEPGYVALWRDFRRVLVQRNEGLRNGVSDAEMDIWDDAFTEVAARLDQVRGAFVARWGHAAQAIGRRLLDRDLAIEYRSGTREGVSLSEALRDGRARERERGLTLSGPQRSEVAIRFGGGVAREVASRGQQKLIAATLIIARLEDRIAEGGHAGMLLVDDPIAELDPGALQRLSEVLKALSVQTLLTAIDAAQIRRLFPGRLFHVEQGVIAPT